MFNYFFAQCGKVNLQFRKHLTKHLNFLLGLQPLRAYSDFCLLFYYYQIVI
jgi:hypothetical protein